MTNSMNHSRFLNPWKLHLQKLGLELNCPLCLMLINEPVLLPCNHIFCKSCIFISTPFEYECIVCKVSFSDQDVRQASYMENIITIYRSMETTLNASLNQSNPDSSDMPCISSLTPKHQDMNDENKNFARRSVGGQDQEIFQLAPLGSNLMGEGDKEYRIHNVNQVTRSSSGSPPSFGDTKGLHDDSSDRGSGHSPEKCSSKRSGHEVSEDHLRVVKRQNKLNHSLVKTSGQIDACSRAFDSNFVESKHILLGLESKCGEADALLPSLLPNSLDEVKTICAFCQSSNITEGTGPMLHYANGKLIVGKDACRPHVIHVHSKCIEWAPQVYFSDENVNNLENELARGAKLKCSACGLKGAALGCYAKTCKKSYHVPCAVEVPDCRWDCENFLLLCPAHHSTKFPNEKRAPVKRFIHKQVVHSRINVEQPKVWDASTHKNKEWVICGSALSTEEKVLLMNFARISGITVSKSWNPNVTHVIAATDAFGAYSRTLKVLMAILHGKWILTIEWIKACMASRHPVDEEPYEVSLDNHGSRDGPKNGRLRLLANEATLLNGFHFLFTGNFITQYLRDLQNLVRAAGGTVLNSKEEMLAQINYDPLKVLVVYNTDTTQVCKSGVELVIFQRHQEAKQLAGMDGFRVIGHTWLLESIAACKLESWIPSSSH